MADSGRYEPSLGADILEALSGIEYGNSRLWFM